MLIPFEGHGEGGGEGRHRLDGGECGLANVGLAHEAKRLGRQHVLDKIRTTWSNLQSRNQDYAHRISSILIRNTPLAVL